MISRLPKTFLALTIISACLFKVLAEVVPVCTPVESNEGPPLPELPHQFSTSIEANILQKAYTQYVEEYYDELGNRGSVRTVEDGTETLMIYDYNTDEMYTVVGGSIGPGFYPDDNLPRCTIERISTGSNPDKWPFGYELINGTAHIRPIGDIFRFGGQLQEEFIGIEEIRGIPTNHWRACINEANSSSFSVDYYFTVPGYDTAYGSDQIPVRAVVNGTSEDVNASGTHDFENIYEFAFFRPSTVYNPYIFETPRGVYCDGREEINLTNPLPTIPEDIRMRLELVSPDARRIENTDAWLSETFKLVRYDHTAVLSRTDLQYDAGDPISEVHDYNTGVAYVINERVGTCVVVPIANTSYEAVPTDPSHVRMRTAQELFFGLTDMNYEYEGAKYIRNILTDVWIGIGTETVQEQTFTSTWEWFFTAENWTENMVSSDPVPIRIDIRSTPETGIFESFDFVISIYEFQETIEDPTVFDASFCFAENQKKILQFQISGENVGYISHSPTLFLKSCQFSIAQSANVSFARVANVMYDYSDVKIYVTFTLLDKAPIDGDAYDVTIEEPSLEKAADTLESSINRAELIIPMEVNDKKFEFVAIPYSLRSDVVFLPDYPFQGDTKICDPQESRIEKPLPVLYESYQVYMEAKFVNEPAYTVEATQYFDTLTLRSSIFAYTASGVFQSIVDFRESIVYIIYPNGSCTAYPYDLSSFLQTYLEPSNDGDPGLLSLGIGMEITKLFGAMYRGTTSVRGIPVDWWRSCVFIAQTQSTFALDWYYTIEGYASASTASPIPVRAVVEGKGLRINDPGAPAHTFKHIYEYSGFRPEVIDSIPKLSVPPGVLCVNDTQSKPLPVLPEYASARIELIYKVLPDDTEFKRQRLDTNYDQLKKLTRTDFVSYGTPYTTIDDFNTGVTYVTNNILGNCSYFPISATADDSVPIGDGLVRMASTYELFKLDGDLVYKGTSNCREMTCESWVTIRYDWPVENPIPTVWEWYFATSSWLEVTDLSWESQVPVQLIVRDVKASTVSRHYYEITGTDVNNIILKEQVFDFNYRESSVTDFTTWNCMRTDNYEYLQFEISSHYNEAINTDRLVFYQRAQAAISTYADVTPLRTRDVQLYIEDGRTFVRFQLYDVAPIQGDVGKIELSISAAENTLRRNIANGKMVIKMPKINAVDDSVGQISKDEYMVYIIADSLQSVQEYTDNNDTYSKGAVIGMGVGMGLLSILLGGLICFLIAFKNRGSVNEPGFTLENVVQ